MGIHRTINRFLAEWVGVINALVAVAIPTVTAFIAGLAGLAAGDGFFGFLLAFLAFVFGGLLGCLVAGAVCGLLAVLLDIRNSLAAQVR